MSHPMSRPQASKQHGQTLAEFAISLPLVLLLLFGILEFGRMFQSWVTLQNAARAAVRYAVTGQYDETKYDLDFLVPCYRTNQAMDPVRYPSYRYGKDQPVDVNIWQPSNSSDYPPSSTTETLGINDARLLADNDNNGYARRVARAYYTKDKNPDPDVEDKDLIIDKWKTLTQPTLDAIIASGESEVEVVRLNRDESLYATWYGKDGDRDCTPTADTEQNRKDMVRLASIYDEARRGAAGLALEPSITGDGSLETFKKFLFGFWSNPSQSQQKDAWFNVTICSARGRMYANTETEIRNNPDDSRSMIPENFNTLPTDEQARLLALQKEASTRFHTWRGPGEAPRGNDDELYVGGACILKEAPLPPPPGEKAIMVDNHNVPWADAGSAGERITIIITYNHPLITPLGLARFVRMQASRSAVNEAFKIVNAERAIGGGGTLNGDFPTNTPTATQTNTQPAPPPTDTPTLTLTPSVTWTPTETPFDCTKLFAKDVEYSGGNTVYVKLQNDNLEDTIYLRSTLAWNSDRMKTASPDAYAGFVSIENQVNWTGYSDRANSSPVDTNRPDQGDSFVVDDDKDENDVFSPGLYITIPANGSARWQLTFIGLTKPLYEVLDLWELGGTRIVMQNPDTGDDCPISLTGAAVLTPTPYPEGQVPTATNTPDCGDLKYNIKFAGFMINGDVHLQVTGLSQTQVGYFLGFDIKWQPAKDKVSNLKLLKVTVNGRNPDDVPSPTNPNGAGTVIWEDSLGGDTSSPTTINKGHADWKQDYIFPAGRTTDLYLDFTGVGAATLSERGVPRSAFNGSQFRISCRSNGSGGNGNGSDPEGDIDLSAEQTPTPAGPPTKTLTPGPTFTFTKTYTPGPTSTNTLVPTPTVKGPDTATPKPSSTPTTPPTSTPNIRECTDRC